MRHCFAGSARAVSERQPSPPLRRAGDDEERPARGRSLLSVFAWRDCDSCDWMRLGGQPSTGRILAHKFAAVKDLIHVNGNMGCTRMRARGRRTMWRPSFVRRGLGLFRHYMHAGAGRRAGDGFPRLQGGSWPRCDCSTHISHINRIWCVVISNSVTRCSLMSPCLQSAFTPSMGPDDNEDVQRVWFTTAIVLPIGQTGL